MKPLLLYRNRDFNPLWGMLQISPSPALWRARDYDQQWAMLPQNKRIVTQDLELDILFHAMAGGDKFLFEVVKNVVLTSVTDTDTILYRQDILKDCIKNAEVVRDIYRISDETIEEYQKGLTWYLGKSADSVRSASLRALGPFIDKLVALRNIAEEHAGNFESEGFKEFFAMLERELPDEYIARLKEKLEELSFPKGILVGVELGKGNKGSNYTLQKYQDIKKPGWMSRVFSREQPSHYSFAIADRDITGFQALAEMKEKSVNTVARILLQSSDHMLGFLTSLKTELAFYIGCLNLREQLIRIGKPFCFPIPFEPGRRALCCKELYDVCMAITKERGIVGNDVNAENKDLIIITGANRGGKSTFLRSAGLAQLMMQCGSFVPAESFCSDVCTGIFTHFKREEDRTMRRGKYDEELSRMSDIVDLLKPDSMVLFNESFAATNEREGSEISRQIVGALLEKRVKVVFVTHLYEFSRGMYERNMDNALFLRAERRPDGERTFKVKEGEPLQTSFGKDLYDRIFQESP
ncbi:MAG: hypothetical protein QMC96_04510 [Methanomicrobiales archaeon]|nr:hypothetical protein [Methanomicrobiales archaeon]